MSKIRQVIRDIHWLWAMWRAKRFVSRTKDHLIFSQRRAFFKAMRPLFKDSETAVIDWPDAWLFVTIKDVRRAIAAAKSYPGPAPRPNPQDDPDG